eukprot:35355_1
MVDEKTTNPYLDNNLLQSIKQQNMNDKAGIIGLDDDDNEATNIQHKSEPITLNIGGTKYQTALSTLSKYKDSVLYKMFEGKFSLQPSDDGSYFIDRDGTEFKYILNYLRDGILIIPKTNNKYILQRLFIEADFYQLTSLKTLLPAYNIALQSDVLNCNNILQIQKLINEEKGVKQINWNWRLLYKSAPPIMDEINRCCKGRNSLLYVFNDGLETVGIYSKAKYNVDVVNGSDNLAFFITANGTIHNLKYKGNVSPLQCPIGYNKKLHVTNVIHNTDYPTFWVLVRCKYETDEDALLGITSPSGSAMFLKDDKKTQEHWNDLYPSCTKYWQLSRNKMEIYHVEK